MGPRPPRADRQGPPDGTVIDQLPHELGPWGVVALQADQVAQPAALGKVGQGSRLAEVDAEWPFGEHVLARSQRAPNQPVVIRDLDGDRHQVHRWTRRQLSAIGESQRDSEGLGGGLGRVEPGGSDRGDLVLAEGRSAGRWAGCSRAPGGLAPMTPTRMGGRLRANPGAASVTRIGPGRGVMRRAAERRAPSVPRDRVALHGHRPVVLGHNVRIDSRRIHVPVGDLGVGVDQNSVPVVVTLAVGPDRHLRVGVHVADLRRVRLAEDQQLVSVEVEPPIRRLRLPAMTVVIPANGGEYSASTTPEASPSVATIS